MCVTYGNNTKSVLLCFTDNTHNVLCVTYGKENITMTELKDKATAPIKQRASKYKAIPASEPHIHINITDNAPLETKERDKYIIIEGRANNYQVVRYRINGKYIVIATISLRVQGTNSFNEKHYHIKSKSNKNDIYSCFVEMLQDVGKWLVIGLLIAALITVAVPNDWLAALHEYKLLNMLIVLAVAIPMYVCATGSIPIAVSLMAKGLTPGAALVLLMAGPAVNSASILVIGKVFGKRTLSLYVLSIIIGAVVFGLGIDYLLPQDWFAVSSVSTAGGHCAHCLTVWDWVFLIVLALLLVNALVCHRHHHDHDYHGHAEENEAHSHAHKATVYKVEGMACNHCKAAVKNAIDVIPGVEKVEVDLAGGKAYVYGKHNTEEVVKAVGERGYNTMLLEE